ncbi:hypothetical protein [Bradyrhizobium sp. URHD0069]|uniref:hypothetical protein n=1 Tax=Bradyrhizobium sp. URHD0069 TaxID=1380355 RepID=UPI00068CBFCC|nr:hypothetical protein [Bradyrhizobium sp. URHD0069]
MKPPRSALPLPRYVERKPLKGGGWGHFFHVPSWARKAGCTLQSGPLGTDYSAAVSRAETILLPAFDAWRTGDASPASSPAISASGTLDWMFGEYRTDRRFTKLDPKSKRNHEVGFKLVGGYVLKDGKRLGEKRLSAIDTALTDDLYEKLMILRTTDADGNVVERERRTTVNHAMKSCRRAWNVVARRHPGKLPLVNPFAQMGLRSSDRETPTATYDELLVFRTKAVELGLPSLATAALIGWEWLQRETDIFATFDVSYYRPKERPNMVRVVDEKTKQESWIPLIDDAGAPIYPELMAELDTIKRERIGGLMLCRDWGNRGPWPTWPKPDQPDFTHLSRKVKEVIRAAGLRDALSFTSFRHGGFTEGGDAELTDREMLAQGRHTTVKVLPKYTKRTTRQIMNGARKRRASRTKEGHLSE